MFEERYWFCPLSCAFGILLSLHATILFSLAHTFTYFWFKSFSISRTSFLLSFVDSPSPWNESLKTLTLSVSKSIDICLGGKSSTCKGFFPQTPLRSKNWLKLMKTSDFANKQASQSYIELQRLLSRHLIREPSLYVAWFLLIAPPDNERKALHLMFTHIHLPPWDMKTPNAVFAH